MVKQKQVHRHAGFYCIKVKTEATSQQFKEQRQKVMSLLFKEQKQKRLRWILGFLCWHELPNRDASNIQERRLFSLPSM